jgi:hypothetical protein
VSRWVSLIALRAYICCHRGGSGDRHIPSCESIYYASKQLQLFAKFHQNCVLKKGMTLLAIRNTYQLNKSNQG